jgi:hypothetical protein
MPKIQTRGLLTSALIFLSAALLSASAGTARRAYVMISGWALYPSLQASPAIETVLATLARDHIAGIVYGTLGIAPRIRAKAHLVPDFDPNTYNQALFKLARSRKADLWLQLRYYDNWVSAAGEPAANLTAPRILSDAAVERSFLASAMDAVRPYAEAWPRSCTIILGEEETLYHAKDGGGLFWAGQSQWDASPKLESGQYLKHSAALDEQFVATFAGINRLLIRRIRNHYPACRVGIHIGHAPLYQLLVGKPVYQLILQKLQPLTPDFTFYDLYDKISKTEAGFRAKLTDRIKLLHDLGQPVYYLAQLHTTNDFGAGGGRTPSAAQIDATFQLARQLGVEGFGYYTKNAVPTFCTASTAASSARCDAAEDASPLDPNTTAQNMVWESSPRRWEYGLSRLVNFLAGGPAARQ